MIIYIIIDHYGIVEVLDKPRKSVHKEHEYSSSIKEIHLIETRQWSFTQRSSSLIS